MLLSSPLSILDHYLPVLHWPPLDTATDPHVLTAYVPDQTHFGGIFPCIKATKLPLSRGGFENVFQKGVVRFLLNTHFKPQR